MRIFLSILFFACCFAAASAQVQIKPKTPSERQFPAYVENEDTIAIIGVQEIIIYPPIAFENEKQKRQYNRLVRDVKKTLPYAKMIYATLIETYEYIQTLPTDKEREIHLKKMEKELFEEYKPVLKKMTLSQGKLLIRLIDRECNQSSYELVKAFLGSFRAGFWNFFAGLFGASLKSEWDPKGDDAAAEQIVVMVEKGQL